jgi:hypothetical protein
MQSYQVIWKFPIANEVKFINFEVLKFPKFQGVTPNDPVTAQW